MEIVQRCQRCMNKSRMPQIYPQAHVFNFHNSILVDNLASTLECFLSRLLSMPQLDESKAYEEMVEALTTKNLELGERCGELEATVADLESSVQLSEELEVQQAEDMRELQVPRSR